MAILDFCKDNEKSIAIHFHSQEHGPEGQPVYYSTPETPAVITGYVEFRTVKELHGHDIALNFQARAESKWTGMNKKKPASREREVEKKKPHSSSISP